MYERKREHMRVSPFELTRISSQGLLPSPGLGLVRGRSGVILATVQLALQHVRANSRQELVLRSRARADRARSQGRRRAYRFRTSCLHLLSLAKTSLGLAIRGLV